MKVKKEKKEKIITSDLIMGILCGIVLTLLVLSGLRFFGIHILPAGNATTQAYNKTKYIEKCIDSYYQGDYTDEELANGAAKGMVAALGDKYSAYYTQSEYDEVMSGINGSYVGIGVTLKQLDDGKIQVEKVSDDGPAKKAGMQVGDVFQTVNGTDITGKSLSDVVAMVKAQDNEGKNIEIKVLRSDEDNKQETVTLQLVCEKINVVSVEDKQIGQTGYIKVTEFDNETDDQFSKAVSKYEKEDIKGLVIDVRDNGGGSLESAINMLNRLLPKGDLITEKSKKEGDKTYYSDDKESYDKPIVVLINGNSASASEVFSGTLKTRGAATLIGTKSFGKGIVQTVFSLKNACGGGIKLTTAKYYLPNGECIHQKGITPDETIEYEKKDTDTENDDTQLQRALQIIEAK